MDWYTTVDKKREPMRIAKFPVSRGKNVLCRLVSAGNDTDGGGTSYLRSDCT